MTVFDDYGKASFGIGNFLSIPLAVSYRSVARIPQLLISKVGSSPQYLLDMVPGPLRRIHQLPNIILCMHQWSVFSVALEEMIVLR